MKTKIYNRKYLAIVFALIAILCVTCVENHVLPNFGSIFITSNPEGASVSLNGKYKGKTPLRINELFNGKYKLELNLSDFNSFDTTLSVEENNEHNLKVFLSEQDPKGSITIISKPKGANVLVQRNVNDGGGSVSFNGQTPLTISNLERGIYNVSVKKDSWKEVSFQIELERDSKITKNIDLTIADSTGGLILTSTPEGAKIFINGEDKNLFTPDTIALPAPETYSVKLSFDQYEDTIFTVQVVAGIFTSKNIVLKNIFVIDGQALPANGGVVNGANSYILGQMATLTAVPNEGFLFVNWTEDGNEVSRESIYTFEVTKNRSLIANFELKEYLISAEVTPTNSGSIDGIGFYKHFETASLTANANDGFKFVEWQENGQSISSNNPITFEVDSERSLTASFMELGNIFVSSDPIGAKIFLDNNNLNKVTPQTITNLEPGEHLITLKLNHFADTTLFAEVIGGETLNLENIYLRDITPDVDVEITHKVNSADRLVFDFKFNQAVITDSLYITAPNGNQFNLSFIRSIPNGVTIDWSYPEKLVGRWVFRFTGNKQNGRQEEFNIRKSERVN